jgi:starch synthase
MIASEALPFSKTGGLADVLGALPPALAQLGWNVTVAVPRYRGTTGGQLLERVTLPLGGTRADVGFYTVDVAERHRVLLVDEPSLFDRAQLYSEGGVDYPDNARRFALLVRAALEYAVRHNHTFDIVHAHDWQAGLAPVYLRTLYASTPVFATTASVFTIHNLAYQGVFEQDWLPRLDLPWSLLEQDGLEFWGRISLLKGGINFSSMITTVSPRYAREIQTAAFGFGFDGILRHRASRLVGILNGIDAQQWNPETDTFLPARFSASDRAGKRECKAAVLREYGLSSDEAALDRPLVGMISRMVDQKGLDLIAGIAHELPNLGATFVVLGTGDARYQEMWRRLAAEHPDTIAVRIGFDEGLAHRIEAGADLFMMPSQFEPCGLNQMYSLRYGTIPIVRRVGGLADTVKDYDEAGADATGFVFDDYTPEQLRRSLRRAVDIYRDTARWTILQRTAMAEDHSWDRSAREYVKIYEQALGSRF